MDAESFPKEFYIAFRRPENIYPARRIFCVWHEIIIAVIRPAGKGPGLELAKIGKTDIGG
jgi:hypothetical protein